MDAATKRAYERVDSIIRATLKDDQLPEKLKERGPADPGDAAESVVHSTGPAKQPEMSTGADMPADEPQSKLSRNVDRLQLALDAIGIVDPFGVADGANAAISAGRMFTDPERRGQHAMNAGISLVSMIPYIGDAAKLGKIPQAAKLVKGIDKASDAARSAKEDRLRDGLLGNVFGGMGGKENGQAARQPASGDVPPGSPPSDNTAGSPRDPEEEREGKQEVESWIDRLKNAGEAVLNFAGPLGKAAMVTIGAVKSLELLNTGVIALNRELSQYSGPLASAYAQFDADELRRKIEKGEAIDGPLSSLLEEQSELRDHIDRLVNPLKAVGIEILAQVTHVANFALAMVQLTPGLKSALDLAEKAMRDDASRDTAWKSFFADVSDGKFDGVKPTFNGNRQEILPRKDHDEVFGS